MNLLNIFAMYPKRRILTGLAAALGVLSCWMAWAQAPQAQPVLKQGSCPSGYHVSGAYCTPSSANARYALPQVGTCPSGYHTSGSYCLANGTGSKAAIIKGGTCPSGYHVSGAYCLRN